jgi:uncharacterized membrane protein YqjE
MTATGELQREAKEHRFRLGLLAGLTASLAAVVAALYIWGPESSLDLRHRLEALLGGLAVALGDAVRVWRRHRAVQGGEGGEDAGERPGGGATGES